MEGPRALRPGELEPLVALTNLVFRPEGGDMGKEFSYFLHAENAAHLRVCAEGERIVAHCGYRPAEMLILGARVRAACLGAVCTHPDFRGKGLATELLGDALGTMKSEGVSLALISGTRGLYTRSGAVLAAGTRDFFFNPSLRSDWEAEVDVAPARPADAVSLAAIYRREPLRFMRPPAEWADIIAGRWCMDRAARLFSIRRGGELVAYAAVRSPVPPKPQPPEDGTRLGEFAGCRRALAAALPRLADLGECPEIRVPVAAWDRPLAVELAARGLEAGGLSATRSVKIVNFPRLMESLRDLLVERAGPRAGELAFSETPGGRVAVALHAERLELSDVEACRMVFGGKSGPDRKMLKGRGELGKVLGAALPVETPWYGYDFA